LANTYHPEETTEVLEEEKIRGIIGIRRKKQSKLN